jgi:predicted GIY-YIG superfamily endonuclease
MLTRVRDVDDSTLTLYRCYDADDRLLYVGITSNLERRMQDHRQRRGWTNSMVRLETVVMPAEEARVEERIIVQTEAPLYNKVYAHQQGPVQLVEDRWWEAL